MRTGNHIKGVPGEAAKAILRVVPLIMRTVRAEMRSYPACRAVSLSVPQFRALNFVERHPAASLSDMAAHMGVTLPSMSRLVDGLVDRMLVIRRGDARDRRRLTLRLSARGRTLLRAAHASTEASIASRLAALRGDELAAVVRGMGVLQPLFVGVAGPGEKANL